jgi:hypothetical protein
MESKPANEGLQGLLERWASGKAWLTRELTRP